MINPKIIIKPTRNNIIAANPLQPAKLNIVRIFDIKANDEILSRRKNTPVRATNHKRLILGTINNKIPIVKIKAPRKTDQTTFER